MSSRKDSVYLSAISLGFTPSLLAASVILSSTSVMFIRKFTRTPR